MNKKILIILIVIIAAIFLVVRVVGKRGIHNIATQPMTPTAESQATTPTSNSTPISATPASPTASIPESLPKLRLSSDTNQIPQSLSIIMGTGSKTDYFTRIKAVHALGKELSDTDIQALFILLNRKKGEDGLALEQLNALKNDVVNVLKSQTRKPVDLANNLMAMYYDKSHDPVWRDYCVQHLGGYYLKIENAAELKMARNVFWSATHETDSSIAGTALIALANNIDHSDIIRDAVANTSLLLSEDAKCGELAKITSLQICANLGEKKILPIARQIAESTASVPLRMSAIAAVGTLGEESDRAMLGKYAASTDTRLRTAAQSALKRLGKKTT